MEINDCEVEMRYCTLFILPFALAACNLLPPGSTPVENGVVLINHADKPLAYQAYELEDASRLDYPGTMQADEFNERRIDVGDSTRITHIPRYSRGDGVAIFLFARPDSIQGNAEADAQNVGLVQRTGSKLKRNDYRVRVEEDDIFEP